MKYRLLLLVLILPLLLIGCREKTNEELVYEAQNMITNLKSYSCTAHITIYGNKSPETYIMKHWYKSPDKYRIEIEKPESLKDKTTIYNGNKAFIHHPRIGQEWTMEKAMGDVEQKMFLGYFISSFLNSETGKISRETIDKKEYILLETEMPGNHPYFNKEKLWFAVEEYYPYRLQILDTNNKVRVDIKYYNFKYNIEIKDEIFSIKSNI